MRFPLLRLALPVLLTLALLSVWGCGSDDDTDTDPTDTASDASMDADTQSDATDTNTDVASDTADMPEVDPDTSTVFGISTPAFGQDDTIPLRFECGGTVIQGPGENIAPALTWTDGPAETMSYAIIMDDVDSGVVHWVIYDIPASVNDIAESIESGYEPAMPAGAKQAEIQGSGYFGYFGPCSDMSVNTYRWTIHAIPTATLADAMQTTTEYEMVMLIQAQSIASAFFSGES